MGKGVHASFSASALSKMSATALWTWLNERFCCGGGDGGAVLHLPLWPRLWVVAGGYTHTNYTHTPNPMFEMQSGLACAPCGILVARLGHFLLAAVVARVVLRLGRRRFSCCHRTRPCHRCILCRIERAEVHGFTCAKRRRVSGETTKMIRPK